MKIQPMALVIAAACTALGGCGGGGSSTPTPTPGGSNPGGGGGGGGGGGTAATYLIGGSVQGLLPGETLTLLNNGGNPLQVTKAGNFQFPTALAAGAAYSVTIAAQPNAATCTVSQGSGSASATSATTVTVACTQSQVKNIALFLDSTTGNLINYSYNATTAQLSPLAGPETVTAAGAGPMAIDASATHAYVLLPNATTPLLAAYSIGGGGVVQGVGQTPLSGQGIGLVFSQGGNFAYVLADSPTSSGSPNKLLATYSVTPSTGVIGSQVGAPLSLSATATIMARNPVYNTLYLADTSTGSISSYPIGANSGSSTAGVPPSSGGQVLSGKKPLAMALTPNGNFLYLLNTDDTILGFNITPSGATQGYVSTSTGTTTTLVAAGSASLDPVSLVVDPSGKFLYVSDPANDAIYQYVINQTTGVLTAMSQGSVATTGAGQLSVVGTAGAASLYSTAGAVVSAFTIDPTSGLLTAAKPAQYTLGAQVNIGAMAFGQ